MQRLEHLNLVLQVSVDEGGDLLSDTHVAGVLAICETAIKILRQQLTRDMEVAGAALILEPFDEGPYPVIVVVDCLLTARRHSELDKSCVSR